MQFQFVGGKPVRVGVHFLPVERADHGRHDATTEALHDDLRVGTGHTCRTCRVTGLGKRAKSGPHG